MIKKPTIKRVTFYYFKLCIEKYTACWRDVLRAIFFLEFDLYKLVYII